MGYDPDEMNILRKRLWTTAYRFAKEIRKKGRSLTGLELLVVLHQMIEETHHHWIEDHKRWDDILAEGEG